MNQSMKTLLAWCEKHGQEPLYVMGQLSIGRKKREILAGGTRRYLMFVHGEINTLKYMCEKYGIHPKTARNRAKRGMPLDEIFGKPVHLAYPVPVESDLEDDIKNGYTFSMTKPFLSWCKDYYAEPLYVRAAMSLGKDLLTALGESLAADIGSILVISVRNVTGSIQDVCEKLEVAQNTVRRRVNMGYPLESAFSKAEIINEGNINEAHTITQSLSEWCCDYNQSRELVLCRLDENWTLEEALGCTLAAAPEASVLRRTLSLHKISKLFGLPEQELRERTAGGMTLLEALIDTQRRNAQQAEKDVTAQSPRAGWKTTRQSVHTDIIEIASTDSNTKKILAYHTKRIRQERGLSISKMAELAGISASMWGCVEKGTSNLWIDTLIKICENLHMQAYELLEMPEEVASGGQFVV